MKKVTLKHFKEDTSFAVKKNGVRERRFYKIFRTSPFYSKEKALFDKEGTTKGHFRSFA